MNSPTLTARATQMGVIPGTAAHMAPEQARGEAADRRAHIWPSGVVLHEMPTDRRAFEGEDISITLASVLKKTRAGWRCRNRGRVHHGLNGIPDPDPALTGPKPWVADSWRFRC